MHDPAAPNMLCMSMIDLQKSAWQLVMQTQTRHQPPSSCGNHGYASATSSFGPLLKILTVIYVAAGAGKSETNVGAAAQRANSRGLVERPGQAVVVCSALYGGQRKSKVGVKLYPTHVA